MTDITQIKCPNCGSAVLVYRRDDSDPKCEACGHMLKCRAHDLEAEMLSRVVFAEACAAATLASLPDALGDGHAAGKSKG